MARRLTMFRGAGRRLRGALVPLALALAAPAEAAPPAGPEPVTPALLAAVAAWVAAESGLPLPAAAPAVVFSDPEAMAALRGDADANAAGSSIVALYDTRNRTIHLPRGWTGASPAEMSVLVHEMVHHMQTAAGTRHACPAEREKAAYAAQAGWLETAGADLAASFELDPMTLLVLTTCGM